MSGALSERLAAELATAGFMPDRLLIKLVGGRIAERGDEEFERLVPKVRAMESHRRVCAHHLGIGASLTDFLISGLPLDRASRSEISSLGGIAHTIYAVFDYLLDVSGSAPELFGTANSTDARPAQLSTDPAVRGKPELVSELVQLYFRKSKAMASKAPRVYELLERGIQKLYSAELRTSTQPEIRWSTWWRKNALPIILMGLPAWILAPAEEASKISFADHLRWLGRVGEFFGWLDDVSDYDRDCASGQANRLRRNGTVSIEGLARRVTAKGERVLGLWDSWNEISAARDTFRVIVWTWLTAPPS